MFLRSFYQVCLLALAICGVPSHAFVPLSSKRSVATMTRSMSSTPVDEDEANLNKMGATERLLMEKAYARDNGLVQRYGKTVKKDGLDGVRAAIWGIFHASQAVFGVLAVALVSGMALNAAGYAYYVHDAGFHGETFQQLNQMHQIQMLEAETARFATDSMIR